jgi:hypothetical protein
VPKRRKEGCVTTHDGTYHGHVRETLVTEGRSELTRYSDSDICDSLIEFRLGGRIPQGFLCLSSVLPGKCLSNVFKQTHFFPRFL